MSARATARYAFTAAGKGQLSLEVGDVLDIDSQSTGWYIGRLQATGARGMVPQTHVVIVAAEADDDDDDDDDTNSTEPTPRSYYTGPSARVGMCPENNGDGDDERHPAIARRWVADGVVDAAALFARKWRQRGDRAALAGALRLYGRAQLPASRMPHALLAVARLQGEKGDWTGANRRQGAVSLAFPKCRCEPT